MKNTLLLIFAALTLMIGSFIWFVATWDASAEQPISFAPPPHSFGPLPGLRPSHEETILQIVSLSRSTLAPQGRLTTATYFTAKGTT